jgi:predicted ABC-type ATPase
LTIRDRFIKGLQLLDKTFDLYDIVNIYSSGENKFYEVACLEPSNKLVVSNANIPVEVELQIPSVASFIKEFRNSRNKAN